MDLVIVRAPLVYGPGNPGNFFTLLRIIGKGIPLPLASVHNQRSYLYVENLTNALFCCVSNPSAAGQMYLVSDLEIVSTPELIRRVASALGCPARLVPFPPRLLRLAGRLLNKSSTVDSVLGSLSVDCSKIQRELSWKPPYSMVQGLKKTADWFKTHVKL
jgi:nucleoside-diphosphate-sugar epimerase